MPFIVLSLVIQVAFILHILKTGRNTTWIWIVLMLPGAGSIAYFLMEILPDLQNSRTGRQASQKLRTVVNPNKDIKHASRNLAIADTVQNSMILAEECLNKGLYLEAKELYEKCLQGIHADDPDLMFSLAQAEYHLGNFTEVKLGLDSLKQLNPDYRNPNAHLLYARALEGLDEVDAALHEYEALHGYFSGPEASFYFAKYLKSLGRQAEAKNVFSSILDQADLSGRLYRSLHKEIITKVKTELRSIR